MRTFEIAKRGTALKAPVFSLGSTGVNSTVQAFGTATGSATTAARVRWVTRRPCRSAWTTTAPGEGSDHEGGQLPQVAPWALGLITGNEQVLRLALGAVHVRGTGVLLGRWFRERQVHLPKGLR